MTDAPSTQGPQAHTTLATSEAPRLLVVTLSNIGDVVLTTPLFEALATAYPNTLIDIVADTRSAALLTPAPYAGEVFLYHKRAGWRARGLLLRALRRRSYRVIVDLRGPILGYLLRADTRLRKPYSRSPGSHAVQEHFAALAPLLPGVSPPPCRLYLSTHSTDAAAKLLTALPGRQWLALAPGANWPGKKWPRNHYRSLLELAAPFFDGAILLGSAQETDDLAALADLALPTLATAGITDLGTAAALLAQARAFVGNDSGLGHIAAAMGTPSLTVFGPGDPTRYRPWGRHAHIVLAPQENLSALTPQQVWLALQALLNETSGAA